MNDNNYVVSRIRKNKRKERDLNVRKLIYNRVSNSNGRTPTVE